MFESTSLTRFRRLLVVAGIVAGVAVPAAGAVSRPPDVRDAATTTALPDVFERYAAAHPYGGLSESTVTLSRPPDVVDAALAVQYGATVPAGSGFQWDDWAIGIGSGLGLVVLCGVAFLTSRQLRHRVQTA
jgi:hypothetical protein